jgi:pilus assembly protein Flp/PilA
VKAFARSQSGATAIEYALIAGSISIVIVTVVTTVGTDVKALFQRLADKM